MTIYRTTATWTGFQGAPGYTKFTWDDLGSDAARNAAGAAMKTFFSAFAPFMQSGWSITVSPLVQAFDEIAGNLQAEASMTNPPTAVTGSAAVGPYGGGSGMTISWKTGSIFNGRKVQGRTFLVPAIGVYDPDGTLTAASIAAMQNAGNALIATTAAKFQIWARQFNTTTTPPVQINGDSFNVTACVVKDMASQLRSRRL